MKIAFIGFGEAARAFAGSLRELGEMQFSAFDILTAQGRDRAVREAASRLGVHVCASAAEAADCADWVISAVTAADSLDAGVSVAGLIGPGQVFIEGYGKSLHGQLQGQDSRTILPAAGNGRNWSEPGPDRLR